MAEATGGLGSRVAAIGGVAFGLAGGGLVVATGWTGALAGGA